MTTSTVSKAHHTSTAWVDDPIAIIGIGLRLPGSIRTPQQFWDFLTNKQSGRCRVPKDRYNVDAFLGPKGKAGHVYTEYGHFLDVDLAAVDSSFWPTSPKELELLDPQQRLMMEVVYECLESSGTASFRDNDIGLYVGALGEDWMDIQAKDPHHSGMHSIAGHGDFAIANRVSKTLGLTGPSMTIRTACSSSLMALHAACQALHVGECSSAVVGGCNLILSPRMTTTMSELGVLSPQGNCRSFDAHADGYVRGEAVNAIHIKRLSHALLDGDPIRSIIRSVCINSDGQRSPPYIPSPESHEILIRRSHRLAGITDLSQTAMIECHGTGTMIGDVREGRAVAKVFGELGGVLIGSVKPNIGHSEGASGLSSIIKMVLALENRTIPPNINFTTPNPKIPFGPARLRVPVECEPWPEGKAERVGLNSFGIGGANGHVLLESAKSFLPVAVKGHSHVDRPQLLVFSATHNESVKRSITSTLGHLKQNPEQVADASYTLACHRQILPYRAFAVSSGDSWDISPVQKAGSPRDLVWIFTGQGAQYAGMGRGLLTHSAVAQDTIRHLDAVLDDAVPGRQWTITEEISRPKSATWLFQAEYSQPCCTALQIALVNVLKSLRVAPAAVVGHSAGEIAAAYTVGALTAAEAILVSYHRGQVASRADKRGGMMAISVGREQVTPYLVGNVTIACENSPRSVTLTGVSNELDAIADKLRECHPDASIKRLPVDCAYHSEQMNGPAEEYMKLLKALNLPKQREQLSSTFVSSVTGAPMQSSAELNSEYWCQNLTSPVLFYSAINSTIETLPNPTFLEVGPHSALSGPLRDIAPSVSYIPTLVRGTDAYTSMLRAAGRLFQMTAIDLSSLCTGRISIRLPPYQWQYDNRFWSESRVSRNWRFRQHSHHDILGSKIPDGNDTEPLWRSIIYIENVPWLRDHVLGDKIVFPRAAYVAMAGEAIRQMTGEPDFSLQHMEFLEEPIMSENQPLEMLTQFRSSQQSGWYEFSITSYSKGVWMKLCTGLAKGGQDMPSSLNQLKPGSRKINQDVYTRALKKLGVNYGPRFCALHNLAASVTAFEATAEVLDQREKQESGYAIHPVKLNSIAQLFSAAVAQGRHIDRLAVLKYIDELYVRSSSGTMACQSIVTSRQESTIYGNAAAFSNGQLVFSLRNAEFSAPKSGNTRGVDSHAGSRLVWQPDIEAVSVTSLIRPIYDLSDGLLVVEELALACMIDSEQRAPNAPTSPHYARYHEWLRMQRRRAERGEYSTVSTCQVIASMPPHERKEHIEKLYQAAVKTPAGDVATAIIRIHGQITALFDGTVDSLSLLLKDDLLSAVYGFKLCDIADFFRVFAHNTPCMKVLEIGAGTGGTTASILHALRGPHGERLYKSYTYTDISPGYFDSARECFEAYDGIVYRTLDITADTAAQGFDATYDLVIASNVLHATPNLQRTLANVKALMKPNGKLFLQELAPSTKWVNYIMGTLPGWWLSTDDRPWEPYVSPERWDAELRASGLSGADAVIHDGQMNAHIISSAPSDRHQTGTRVTVLCDKDSVEIDLALSVLHAHEFTCDVRYLGDELPDDRMVISLLELNGPVLHSMTEGKYLELRDMITSLDSRPTLWVTRSSQVNCSDPRYAATLGLLRTARRELGLTIVTLELDSLNEDGFQAIATVANRVQHLDLDAEFDPVLEYAYLCGTLMIGKFYPAVVGEELLDVKWPEGQDSNVAVLDVRRAGVLKSFDWRSKSLVTPLSENDWVEVETRVVGLTSNGFVPPGNSLGTSLRIECTGTVQRIGPGVKNLRVGDRVIALPAGARELATRIITNERLCVRMARGLSWSEGASMPLAFATALYSLIDVARLKHGNTVLIQSARSEIGLAAIQVCRIIGATAYCIVDDDAELEYLLQSGISKERIFEYRDGRFVHDVFAATQERGVDVVLNSLSGDTMRASWKCVAEFGIFVDIGERPFRHQPTMDISEGNRTFSRVSLGQMSLKRPDIIQGLLRRCMHHYALGELSPLPLQEFSAIDFEHAFQFPRGGPIRKVAVVMPEDSSSLPMTAEVRTASFCYDGIHIIIGGLGGLGRSVSSWMACHGARHFLFFSPSAADRQEDEFVLELRAQGCRVDLVSGDVSNTEDVDSLIKSLNPDTPVAGVIQASMFLVESSLSSMSFAQWTAAFAPKVQGTWNLHNSLLKYRRRTDYFLLFSSLSGLIGQTGHANYAAGNAFLDAFVQYRHSLGLPCSSINIGVMEDVGYVSEQPHIVDHFVATGTHTLQERDLLDAVQLAIENSLPAAVPSPVWDGQSSRWPSYVSHSQLCIGLRSTSPLDSPTNRISWRRDPRMALYHNLNKADTEKTAAKPCNADNDRVLEHFLNKVKLDPRLLTEEASAELLGGEAGKALFSLMLRDHSELDLNASLSSLGADSLLVIKLKDWIRRKFDVDITVVQILGSSNLRELGRAVATAMVAKAQDRQ